METFYPCHPWSIRRVVAALPLSGALRPLPEPGSFVPLSAKTVGETCKSPIFVVRSKSAALFFEIPAYAPTSGQTQSNPVQASQSQSKYNCAWIFLYRSLARSMQKERARAGRNQISAFCFLFSAFS
jgi:hypothetical protein